MDTLVIVTTVTVTVTVTANRGSKTILKQRTAAVIDEVIW